MCVLTHVFMTPWTVARQAPLSVGFPRQECWGRLPFPLPGDLPDPGIKPVSPALQADSLPLSHLGIPVRPLVLIKFRLKVLTKIHHSFHQGAHTVVSSLLEPLLIFREIFCRLKKLSLKGNSALGSRPFLSQFSCRRTWILLSLPYHGPVAVFQSENFLI